MGGRLSGSLAMVERGVVSGRDGIAQASYEADVSLPRMGSIEREAGVSCRMCDLGLLGRWEG